LLSSPFAFIIITVKIISNFENEGCTFDKEKGCLEKKKKTIVHSYFEHAKGLSKHYQFSSNFEQ